MRFAVAVSPILRLSQGGSSHAYIGPTSKPALVSAAIKSFLISGRSSTEGVTVLTAMVPRPKFRTFGAPMSRPMPPRTLLI
jgi:hypothetical protein